MTPQWGRRETVVWPPHSPIYSYGAILAALVCTGMFLWVHFTFAITPLEQYYTPSYVRSAAGALFGKRDKFRVLNVGDGNVPGHPAIAADVIEGVTATPEGKTLPLALSQEAMARGMKALYRSPETSYLDAPFHAYLKRAVYGGSNFLDLYRNPLLLGLGALVLFLPFAMRRDIARRKQLKYGRRLKGPILMTPKQFNQAVVGDGIGFKTNEQEAMIRIPLSSEAQHFEIIGDSGSGKTTLIVQMLRQIQTRKESAIIYDPACEFVQRFYDPLRGDIILNPLDERCPYWGPSEELRSKAEAKAIAASLYQPTNDRKGEFFTETPQKIFAHLLTYGPTPQELIQWMSNPDEIDRRVAGSEHAAIIAKGAQQQRAGVLASLGLIADSLRMLPTQEQSKTSWSATEWAEKREGWIFITSKAAEREALRPLHSLWIDLLVLRLLNTPEPGQKKVWFVLDELASLQRLPQLHTAITENRKSRNPLVLGFHGKAQLEVIYGHMAEVMLSQPATKIFLKTTEPKGAEWVSKAVGNVEIERMKETHYDGTRAGKNFSLDRQTEPLVMDSEISGLADKHAFLKLGNNVVRFSFAYAAMAPMAPAFVPRKLADDELSFDPKTLRRRAQSSQKDVAALSSGPVTNSSAAPQSKSRARPRKTKTATPEIAVPSGTDLGASPVPSDPTPESLVPSDPAPAIPAAIAPAPASPVPVDTVAVVGRKEL